MTYKYTDFLKICDERLNGYPEEYISNDDNAYAYDFFYKNIHLWHRKFSGQVNEVVEVEIYRPFVQLIFSISSKTAYFIQENNSFIELGHKEHNIFACFENRLRFEGEKGEELELVGINLTVDFFLNYLPGHHPHFEAFRDALAEGVTASLSSRNLVMNPKMLAILHEVINIPIEAPFKHLLIEAKVVELLSLQFSEFEQLHNNPNLKKLKPQEIERMYLARDIMIENIKYPCSLINLAQQVGTNENYLKSHFKQVFGTTVHGYLQSAKMEKAKEMLVEQEDKVGQVARKLGYKHSSHFTTAFKKHFGFLPTKIKLSAIIWLTEIDPLLMVAVY